MRTIIPAEQRFDDEHGDGGRIDAKGSRPQRARSSARQNSMQRFVAVPDTRGGRRDRRSSTESDGSKGMGMGMGRRSHVSGGNRETNEIA